MDTDETKKPADAVGEGLPSLGLQAIIEEQLPKIAQADGNIFLRNHIDLLGIEARLYKLYGQDPRLEKLMDGLRSIARAVASCVLNVRFFLIDHPDSEQLDEVIQRIKEILDGRFFSEDRNERLGAEGPIIELNFVTKSSLSNAIPNIFGVDEEHYALFASFESILDTVKKALYFLKESERRKIAFKIASHSQVAKDRALKAKGIIEHYLEECRSLVDNPAAPLPAYYDQTSKVVENIKEARKSILI